MCHRAFLGLPRGRRGDGPLRRGDSTNAVTARRDTSSTPRVNGSAKIGNSCAGSWDVSVSGGTKCTRERKSQGLNRPSVRLRPANIYITIVVVELSIHLENTLKIAVSRLNYVIHIVRLTQALIKRAIPTILMTDMTSAPSEFVISREGSRMRLDKNNPI